MLVASIRSPSFPCSHPGRPQVLPSEKSRSVNLGPRSEFLLLLPNVFADGIATVPVGDDARFVAPTRRIHNLLQPPTSVSEFGRQAIAERFMKQALDRLIVRNAFVQTGTGTARANANARILRKWPAQVRRRR